jgi:hypothetical protein
LLLSTIWLRLLLLRFAVCIWRLSLDGITSRTFKVLIVIVGRSRLLSRHCVVLLLLGRLLRLDWLLLLLLAAGPVVELVLKARQDLYPYVLGKVVEHGWFDAICEQDTIRSPKSKFFCRLLLSGLLLLAGRFFDLLDLRCWLLVDHRDFVVHETAPHDRLLFWNLLSFL